MKAHPAVLTADEVNAGLAGTLTQIYLPAWTTRAGVGKPSRWHDLKPGDLLWVQEPFIEFIGWRKGAGHYGIGYGHVGRGTLSPPHMRDVEKKVHPRGAERMKRSQSRLTLEVLTATRQDGSEVVVDFRPRAQNIDTYLAGAPSP